MVYTDSEVSNSVNGAIEEIANSSKGLRITELLKCTSEYLQRALTKDSPETFSGSDNGSDLGLVNVENEDQEDEDDVYANYSDFEQDHKTSPNHKIDPNIVPGLNRRIKEDLRAVRFANFKLGILDGLRGDSQTSVLSISVQISKLGLSEEVLQAWDLEPQQYVVILIRYSSGYITFESIMAEAARSCGISLRIGVSNRYKPKLHEALASFTDTPMKNNPKKSNSTVEISEGSSQSRGGFRNLFISSSLNEFVNDQFISLLKIRVGKAVGWDDAKRFYDYRLGLTDEVGAHDSIQFNVPSSSEDSLPSILTADHIIDSKDKDLSFPLIAAQFSLRYLLRCTKFCLVCHDKLKEEFEALKPYVCSKPLCLYQYMSLGFGPSVEHEILTQPYVVDLLISFCYAAAKVNLKPSDKKLADMFLVSKTSRISNRHEPSCTTCERF
jgi:ubiquitin-conjugating enzyme E2 Q